MNNKIIVIGASGHGKVVAEIAELTGFEVEFWDDDTTKTIKGYSISNRKSENLVEKNLVIAIGNNKIREKISVDYPNIIFTTLIHPQAIRSSSSQIGAGSVVMAGACINVGTTIGNHCIINTGAVVDHDCVIDNFVHISPNATLCGNVEIGKSSWVGAGSTIIQQVKIGENVIIGAGSVVIKNVPDNSIVVGNPGRVIKTK